MRLFIAGSLALAIVACRPDAPVDLRVAEGATTPAPRFIISGQEAPRSIFVERITVAKRSIGPKREWTLMRRGGEAVATPLTLTYATVPAGYVAAAPAALLSPGQYQLIALSGGRRWVLDFHIVTDGKVVPGVEQPFSSR
jgi:hypothetical protein